MATTRRARIPHMLVGLTLAAMTVAMAWCLAWPATAHAVVNLGTVGVAVPESIAIDSGQTGQVAVACDPAYSDQYPNCLNDYCPSGCDFGKTGDGVACEDATGQCTCYGYKSARYYPSCTVSSSNPSVVRASWSDGVLTVTGYKAGSATLTVVPALRLFSSLPATIRVTVAPVATPEPDSAPAQAQTQAQKKAQKQGSTEQTAPADSAATSASTAKEHAAASTKSEKKTGSAAAQSGGVSASSATSGAKTGAVAVASSAGSASAGANTPGATTSPTSGAGTVVSVIEQANAGASAAGDTAQAAEGTVSSDAVHKMDGPTPVGKVLAEAAGTPAVVTFWGGKDAEAPDFMLVIAGANVPAGVSADLALDVHEATDEQLAAQLGGMPYTAFAIDGAEKLPCTTQVFWRTTNAFENGTVVNVYQFDRESGTFEKIHANITTGEGYACFNVIDGGTYVIAERDDLDAAAEQAPDGAPGDAAADEPEQQPAAQGGDESAGNAGEAPGEGDAGLKRLPPWTAPLGVAAAAAAAGVATYSVRRRNAAASEAGAMDDAAVVEAGDAEATGAGNARDDAGEGGGSIE